MAATHSRYTHQGSACLIDGTNCYFADFDLVYDLYGRFEARVQVDEVAVFHVLVSDGHAGVDIEDLPHLALKIGEAHACNVH